MGDSEITFAEKKLNQMLTTRGDVLVWKLRSVLQQIWGASLVPHSGSRVDPVELIVCWEAAKIPQIFQQKLANEQGT